MKSFFNVKTLTTCLSILSSRALNESSQSEAVSANKNQVMGKFHFTQSQPIAIPDTPTFSQCKMNSVAIGSGRKSSLESDWNICESDEYINSDEEETSVAGSGSESSYPGGYTDENNIGSDDYYEPKGDECGYPREARKFDIEFYPLHNPLTVIEEEDEEEKSTSCDLRGVEEGPGKF